MTNSSAKIFVRFNRSTASASFLAYQDALAGRGFAPEHETWNKIAQWNYETMRLRVVELRAKGLPVPLWRSEATMPLALLRATDKAQRTPDTAIAERNAAAEALGL